MKIIYILITVFFLIPEAQACSFQSDCSIGAKCVKSNYSDMYGVCVGGLNPGNGNDRRPVKDFNHPNYGNTCSFDYQCGAGSSCLKSQGSIKGICSR